MAFSPLPIIGEYALSIQISILAVLIATSYFHRLSRIFLATLITFYAAYKIIIPLASWAFGWGFWAVKGVAMFGFYVHFFQLGIGYIVTAASYMFTDGHEWLLRELEKYERSRT